MRHRRPNHDHPETTRFDRLTGFRAGDEFGSYDWSSPGTVQPAELHPMNAWLGLRSWHMRPGSGHQLRWSVRDHWGSMSREVESVGTHQLEGIGGHDCWNTSGWRPGGGRSSSMAA